MVKVRNMTGRTGQPVKNQFIISDGDCLIFQSYHATIAKKVGYGENEKVFLDSHYWDYSTTTGKYRNQFLGMNKAQTESDIKAGNITLADLNQ